MADTTLFVIPHAGGSAMGYMNFKRLLDDSVSLVPLELAGRGKRIKEPCFDDIEKCAEDLFEKHKDEFKKGNYAFFGHSLGSLIAFALSRILKVNGYPDPIQIFFSGRQAPCVNMSEIVGCYAGLNDEEFINKFTSFSALPEALMNNKELITFILPILRSDICMAENYHPVYKDGVLSCDITILSGINDLLVSGQNIDLWRKCTTGKLEAFTFNGSHFYFNDAEQRKLLCDIINKKLAINSEVLKNV
ncbi:MAG: thioesterase domain-containing protein [Oscillospiraceae bacterium]|nr:thioesterase domain-containing protein [Oscillospiraceae bacterium]